MSMTIRLDTQGLRNLIEDNPEFKVEIQQCVMNNIKSDNMDNAIRDRIATVLRSMGTGGDWTNRKITITDVNLIDAIKTVVDEEVKVLTAKSVKNAIDDLLVTERTFLRKELKLLLKDHMIDVLTPEMAKEILLTKLV